MYLFINDGINQIISGQYRANTEIAERQNMQESCFSLLRGYGTLLSIKQIDGLQRAIFAIINKHQKEICACL
jgi:hypothetical protein